MERPDSASDQLVDALLDGLLDVDRAARAVELERLCAEHPDHAETLRRRLATLDALGFLGDDDDDSPFAVPERLGPFRLHERLGGGGMGVVYRAHEDGLDRTVALKLVRPEMAYFEQSRKRFQREASAVARLSHAGIVPVYAYGEAGGIPYLAMELVDGTALDAVLDALRDREPAGLAARDLLELAGAPADSLGRGWNEACARLTLQVADALAHAHERGVVHRDVKPSNVMLDSRGVVRVVDFGLASAVGDSRITRTGTQLGSLAYSSPEQLRGGDVDGRSDVFSLGALLYELLTMRRAFGGESPQEITHRIVARDPEPVRRANPAAALDLEAIALRALEKNPDRRYGAAAAMAADLRAFLEFRPVRARRLTRWVAAQRWARREPFRAVLLLVVAVGVPLLAGLSGYLYATRDERAAGRETMRREQVEALVAEGFLALANDDDAAAARAFGAARALDPEDATVRAGLDALRARSDATYRQPVSAEELATIDGPVSAERLFTVAVRLEENGRRRADLEDLMRAMDLYQRANDRSPARALYLQRLAGVAGRVGDPIVADRAAEALQSLWPDDALAWSASGLAFLEIDADRAVACFERAKALRPGLAGVSRYLSVALFRAGRTDEAVGELREAVRLAPADPAARIDLGVTLLELGDPDAARDELEVAVERSPWHAGAHYNLGRVRDALGDDPGARASFAKTVELAPDYAEAWSNLGTLAMRDEDYARATAAYAEVTELRPDWPVGWKNLASAHWYDSRFPDAIAALRRAAALVPADREVHEDLCTLLEFVEDADGLAAERARFAQGR